MKAIVIPDSFKGTMSSEKICSIYSDVIKKHYPDAEVVALPVADGGEGTVDAYLTAVGGDRRTCSVTGPYFEKMSAYYGVLKDGTAVIEMAACAGLPLVEDRKNPLLTTTYGVGELIKEAVSSNCRKIIVGLGGSCTNDGGCGAAAALGVKFYDEDGKAFVPTGGTLSRVQRIDMSGLMPELKNTEIIAMCDVDNPFYGKTGAAYIFSPQKGASEEDVVNLDGQLKAISDRIQKDLGIDVSSTPGAGAAGGMGGGMIAFLNAVLQRGIETVLDTVNFDKYAKDADLVFTGEGRLDSQSLHGKVIAGVSNRCRKLNVPLIAVVGDIKDDGIDGIYDMGVTAIFSINRLAVDFSIAKNTAEKDMKATIDNIMRFTKRLCTKE